MVPIPFNFNEVEIGAIPTTINEKKTKVGMDRIITPALQEENKKRSSVDPVHTGCVPGATTLQTPQRPGL
jgi:hypothetical protein